MLKEKPDFDANALLHRFIDEIYHRDTNRASPAAFIEDEDATRDGLSVNSGEVETLNQVAANFASKMQVERPVAVATHKVSDYTVAANSVELGVSYDTEKRVWLYHGSGGDQEEAYQHNPKAGNRSHSLVRFTRHLDETRAFKFARLMAYKPTYDLV